MKLKPTYTILSLMAALTACAEQETSKPHPAPKAPAQAPKAHGTISIQEMIETGPPQMRLHSLAMITQGKVKEMDDSYLKTFALCATDPNVPVRSVAARIVGTNWIKEGKEENPEAIKLLLKFSNDTSKDVRFSAVYYGLANVQNKSDALIDRLIEIVSTEREQTLIDQVKKGLEGHKKQVKARLDQQLIQDDDNQAVRAFEIYEELTGTPPAETERFLKLPSSRPVLFIFALPEGNEVENKARFEAEAKKAGLEQPDIMLSGAKKQQVLLLKTYLTRDRINVQKYFADHPDFQLTQQLWLSPELEVQMEAMRKK